MGAVGAAADCTKIKIFSRFFLEKLRKLSHHLQVCEKFVLF